MDPGIPPPPGGSALPFVNPPAPSHIPPTDADISNAHDYLMDVTHYRRRHPDDIADVDYADAVRYETRVLAHTQAAEPAWFQPALQAALDTALAPITNMLDTIQLRQQQLLRIIAKDINGKAGAGEDVPLLIVPFPDGTDPSEVNPSLPLLNTVRSVHALSDQNQTHYLQRYYPDLNFIGVAHEDKVKILFVALGCRA